MIQEPLLMQNQNGALNEDIYAQKEFFFLREENNLKYAIETGTCLGYTTEYLSQMYDLVHTIEIAPNFKKIAYENRLKNLDNVKMYEGSSSTLLRTMIQDLPSKEGIFIFLDAHWGTNCPLKDELRQIAEEGIKPVIAIHDFVVPNRPELGFDSINGQPFNYEWLKEDFDKIYGEGNYKHYYNSESTGAKRGIIYIVPLKK